MQTSTSFMTIKTATRSETAQSDGVSPITNLDYTVAKLRALLQGRNNDLVSTPGKTALYCSAAQPVRYLSVVAVELNPFTDCMAVPIVCYRTKGQRITWASCHHFCDRLERNGDDTFWQHNSPLYQLQSYHASLHFTSPAMSM